MVFSEPRKNARFGSSPRLVPGNAKLFSAGNYGRLAGRDGHAYVHCGHDFAYLRFSNAKFRQLSQRQAPESFYSLVIGSVAVCILGILFFQGPAKAQAANEPEPDPLLQKSRFQNVIALNNLAWVLATSPDNQIRDGSLAVELARRACELTHYETPIPMSTLAAAYAEAGHFEDAVSTAQDACTLAGQLGETNVLNKNQQLLLLYQSHKPYRVTELPANSPSPSR